MGCGGGARGGARGWVGAGSDDPVGQEVAQRHGDGQSLHLLRGLHPAEGHPAQVLQAGDAAGTLPEVHAPVAGPASKQTAHQRRSFHIKGAAASAILPSCKDTSCGGEGTAEAIGQRGDGLRSPFLDAPEPDQAGGEGGGGVALVRDGVTREEQQPLPPRST